MGSIDEDITVKEFVEKNNSLIHLVFDGNDMKFPNDDLNLNGKMITYDARG